MHVWKSVRFWSLLEKCRAFLAFLNLFTVVFERSRPRAIHSRLYEVYRSWLSLTTHKLENAKKTKTIKVLQTHSFRNVLTEVEHIWKKRKTPLKCRSTFFCVTLSFPHLLHRYLYRAMYDDNKINLDCKRKNNGGILRGKYCCNI